MNIKPPRANLKRISDAADELGLKSHVLRYWETEFPQLKPIRTRSGQRLYDTSHMALLRHIQDLLHAQGMTIEGARRVLNALLSSTPPPVVDNHAADSLRASLRGIHNELLEIQTLLNPLRLQKSDQAGMISQNTQTILANRPNSEDV